MGATDYDLSITTMLITARKRAGYMSPGEAELRGGIPYSKRSILRHEAGEIGITPESLAMYAQAYDAPELLMAGCNECPVYRALHRGRKTMARPLAQTTVRLVYVIKKLNALDDALLELAGEEMIDPAGAEVCIQIDKALADVIHAAQEARLSLVINRRCAG